MTKGLFWVIALLVLALIGGAFLKIIDAPALAIKGAMLVVVFSFLTIVKSVFDYCWKKRK